MKVVKAAYGCSSNDRSGNTLHQRVSLILLVPLSIIFEIMFQEIIDTWKDRIWKDDRLLDLQQFAKEHGWQFRSEGRFPDQPTALKHFQLFKGKKSKRIRGILSERPGAMSFTTRIYDFVYYGDARKRHTTVLEYHYPGIELQHFMIRPKRTMKQIKEIFVRQEEEFYLQDAFFSKYELIYDRRRSIKLHLTEDILKLMCSRNGMFIECNGQYMLAYYKNKTLSPVDLLKEHIFTRNLFTEIIEHSSILE